MAGNRLAQKTGTALAKNDQGRNRNLRNAMQKLHRSTFIDNVLSSMVKEDIPRLYPKYSQEITVHFDSAKLHVAILTRNSMEENHPNYVPQDHWMANSPTLLRWIMPSTEF
ncbi:hypothetical protein RvY_14793 [Ramazzottius varieornatus]|uniref:Uncharacterized protein n=1 Tax=Ramazzottius varieornatus TaxID=947166 RepID=A0A1D1VZR0_RAMVA|nr:hypothetical protein RvY_14793 [Ramazzottius varieornatus]